MSTTIDLECYAISDLFWKMIDDVFVDGIRRDQITVAVCYHYPKRRVQSQKLADVVAGADLGSRAMTVSPIPFAVHKVKVGRSLLPTAREKFSRLQNLRSSWRLNRPGLFQRKSAMSNAENIKTATLQDVLPTLNSPEAYIRGIFRHLDECKTKHGSALVCIGAATRGLIPDYRVSFRDETGQEFVFGTFYGDDHSQIRSVGPANGIWGSSTISFDDVQNLLGKIQGWKGKNR